MEDEDDIVKFKDYKASASPGVGVASAPSEPTSKKEEVEPVKTHGPVAPKADETPRAEDRVFSSPLARKLAEDHNVSENIALLAILYRTVIKLTNYFR